MTLKASDTDGEVSEATKKKHVTMEERPGSRSNSPKTTKSSVNRYYDNFYYLLTVSASI